MFTHLYVIASFWVFLHPANAVWATGRYMLRGLMPRPA